MKAIKISVPLGTVDESSIKRIVAGAEVFSGGKKGDYIVVVQEAAFDDAISKLKEWFGVENVIPYVSEVGESKKTDIIHNLAGGVATDKGKQENYFFVP